MALSVRSYATCQSQTTNIENVWTQIGLTTNPPSSLPINILEILERNSKLFEGKSIKDAYMVIYEPEIVNGKPYNLNRLSSLFESSETDCKVTFNDPSKDIVETFGEKNGKGLWYFIAKEPVPRTAELSYSDQREMISENAIPEYKSDFATLLQASTALMIDYLSSKTSFYYNPENRVENRKYTRCRELLEEGNTKTTTAIGNLTNNGFSMKKTYNLHLKNIMATPVIELAEENKVF